MPDDYALRQPYLNRSYEQAWEDASPEFKEQAAAVGIKPMVDGESHAMEHQGDYANAAVEIDFAAVLDSLLDELTERLGSPKIIRAVLEAVTAVVERRVQQDYSHKLYRVIMLMVSAESSNLKAKVHHIMHAIPGMAKASGFSSLRQSAKVCGCTPEWMRKGRDQVCLALGVPVPEEGRKSPEAKAKYKEVATENHWRHQKFTAAACQQCITDPMMTVIEGEPGKANAARLLRGMRQAPRHFTKHTNPT